MPETYSKMIFPVFFFFLRLTQSNIYDHLLDLNLCLCEKVMRGSSDTHRAQKGSRTLPRHRRTAIPSASEKAAFKEQPLGN